MHSDLLGLAARALASIAKLPTLLSDDSLKFLTLVVATIAVVIQTMALALNARQAVWLRNTIATYCTAIPLLEDERVRHNQVRELEKHIVAFTKVVHGRQKRRIWTPLFLLLVLSMAIMVYGIFIQNFATNIASTIVPLTGAIISAIVRRRQNQHQKDAKVKLAEATKAKASLDFDYSRYEDIRYR